MEKTVFAKMFGLEAQNSTSNASPEIYFIGIKGTGMCALAQLLKHLGCRVSGSDVAEHFYTDELLRASNIFYHEGFRAENLPNTCDLVIYSAAYDGTNPEYAAAEHSLQLFSYPEALGAFARFYSNCIAVAGVHGKTTSTLLLSSLMQGLELKATAVAGAGAPHLGGNAFLAQGSEVLAIETCEYRNHFFHFQPNIVLLTSLEWDHQDFFASYAAMQDSFRSFIEQESVDVVVYCADDIGVRELIEESAESQKSFVPYGFAAQGAQETYAALRSVETGEGETLMYLRAFPDHPLRLRVPGAHLALNALGGLAALFEALKTQDPQLDFAEFFIGNYERICSALEHFSGASRRSELLGELLGEIFGELDGQNILVLDDYAHHPTAIAKTLQGLKEFYPQRRLVLDFMSHTYTRTESLHREFSKCFQAADQLILHDIYASAREQNESDYNGRVLWQAVNTCRQEQGLAAAYYFDQPLDALPSLLQILRSGDLFVTMGAGSNRELALALLEAAKTSSSFSSII